MQKTERSMKGKSVFIRSEANAIIALIRQKLKADSVKQKGIRNKIRTMGFYAQDFGIGGGYTVEDFLGVVEILEDGNPPVKAQKLLKVKTQSIGRRNKSDECYVLDICDEVLGLKSLRQYRFDFLVGDSGVRLPVDAYYEKLKLVIEYKEKQHTEPVKFFDRKMTVSGIGRGEQRKKYDQLRLDILPINGINVFELFYSDFSHNSSKRIIRSDAIKETISEKLKLFSA
jgi:hypothetical protein